MLALQFPQQDGWPSRRTSTEHLEREGPQYQDVVPVLVPRDRDVASARARFLIGLGLRAPDHWNVGSLEFCASLQLKFLLAYWVLKALANPAMSKL